MSETSNCSETEIETDIVTSEVNVFLVTKNTSGDQLLQDCVVSKLTFTCPSWWNEENKRTLKIVQTPKASDSLEEENSDSDFDDVPRCGATFTDLFLELEHKMFSTIKEVGHQIWRGSFLMADYFLQHRHLLLGKSLLELGAGVGLGSIVATLCGAEKVLATDLPLALPLLRRNIERNLVSNVITASVLDVDNDNDFSEKIVDVIFGADIVYDNNFTDGLIKTLSRIIATSKHRRKFLFLFAIEKRFVFTIKDLHVLAPAYEYFVSKVDQLKESVFNETKTVLEIDEISTANIHQSFCYERTKDLVFLQLTYNPDCVDS